MKKVVLDTSFLIVLTSENSARHATARAYWDLFISQNIAMFIPTIVASEYCVKVPIPPYVFEQCILAPFNYSDAMCTGDLCKLLDGRTGEDSRVAIKDDLKIIAQAMVMGAHWTITDDAKSFDKYVRKAAELKSSPLLSLKLQDGVKAVLPEKRARKPDPENQVLIPETD